MGPVDSPALAQTLGNRNQASGHAPTDRRTRLGCELIVILFAAAVFLGCIPSPPALMDDVDAVQAQISRNMLESGDWVTARLNGVKYLEKAPLKYWMIAASYMIFGVHDWAARLPLALAAIALCWLVARFGAWAFCPRAGLYAGLALATCAGMFLFTRVLIPDAVLTLTITLAMWSFLRALDANEPRPRLWAAMLAASVGTGLLLKGLIAAVIPTGTAIIYLSVTKQLFVRETWRRLRPFSGALIVLLVAAPWHIVATLRNPPYFDITFHSAPGEYRGFFWFYFMNEHVLRFLNLRHPRDYNTVPRLWFWLLHLLWLFPWSVFLPAAAVARYRGSGRAERTRLLALCWAGFILLFFTFSTTQEYYSMPAYPALALLLGSGMAQGGAWIERGRKLLVAIAVAAAVTLVALFVSVRNLPTPGDIASALRQNPEAYTLSLGHMGDLTLASFAYLRLPVVVAALAMLTGAVGAALFRGHRALLAIALMMVVLVHAARLALVAFDPYLSSRPLAEALKQAPEGRLIADNQYYTFSSVFFYANRQALLLNGRVNNLEYGSHAPDAPDVFIDDHRFRDLWLTPDRCYVLVERPAVPRISALVGGNSLRLVSESGGKFLFTNRP